MKTHISCRASLRQHRQRLFDWLAFLYDPQAIRQVKKSLTQAAADGDRKGKRAYALEMLDILVEPELKSIVIPLLEGTPPESQLQRLSDRFPQERMNCQARIQAILTTPDAWIMPWLKCCALFTVAQCSAVGLSETVAAAIDSPFQIVKETALRTLSIVDSVRYNRCLAEHPEYGNVFKHKEGKTMLTTFEKIVILKAVKLFADTSEEALADVAAALEEVRLERGERIFQKGDPGSSMYVIVSGQVRVHDQERTLTTLGEHEVFGDLAVLNSEPRSASVTALEDTHVLRLDQEPLYEIIEDHHEIARSIIQLLVRRLQRVQFQSGRDTSTDDVLSEIHEKLL